MTSGSGTITPITALGNNYATLAEYKTWIAVRGLGGTVGADASDDGVIDILLEAASRYIDRETGKWFYTASETRYYTAQWPFEVEIDPLNAITSISVDYTGARSYTALAATDYDLLPSNAPLEGFPYTHITINTLISSAYFPIFRNSVKIAGKFGWAACPAEIKEACLSIAQNLYSARSGQTSNGNVTVTAAGIIIRPQDVPAFAQKIIESYRSLI